jgi:hypothetical protein
MKTDDITTAARLSAALLRSALDADWDTKARDLDWSCRRTLDHIIDTMVLYASAVAICATGRSHWIPPRNGDPSASISELLATLESSAAMLELVCAASPPPVRAFHPSGLSDADGFRAMACSEILTHTDDIARGLGLDWRPPDDICERILQRVFPWAPDATECSNRWEVVRWCCGRAALPTRARLNEKWWWHAAPIAEWDGTRKQRTAPPAWA